MKKILVIDDTAHLLEEIRDLLTMEGYEVTTALSASEGLKRMEDVDPDLIITDVLMPEVDGFQFLKTIKAEPRFKTKPVIVLSAQVTKETERRAKAHKADAYLHKPCSADALIDSIENLL